MAIDVTSICHHTGLGDLADRGHRASNVGRGFGKRVNWFDPQTQPPGRTLFT